MLSVGAVNLITSLYGERILSSGSLALTARAYSFPWFEICDYFFNFSHYLTPAIVTNARFGLMSSSS